MIEHMFDIDDQQATTVAGDPMALIRAGLGEVAGRDRADWTSDALSEELVGLLEVRERLDAAIIRTPAEWKRRRAWEADGSLSAVAWLTYRAPIGRSEARRLVKTTRVIDDAPLLGEALADGDTTTAHVQALASVMSDRRRPLLADHEQVLADQAGELSIRDFTVLVRRWAAIADDYLAADGHGDQVPRNVLYASVTWGGRVVGNFDLEPVAGAELVNVLDHLAPPDPKDAPDGVRSLSQRRGDALAELVHWYQQGAEPGANPPNLDTVIDIATLNGDPPELAQVRCEIDGIGPVTHATLDRIACGATLRRLVMAGDSIILDMGRKTRLATPAQARAVRIRDTGCVFASCDRPAPWCDIHHVNEWTRHNGPTNVANLVCLCTRHHTLIHNTKWTITINPDGTYTTTHPTRAP
jgi:hypothetical protein